MLLFFYYYTRKRPVFSCSIHSLAFCYNFYNFGIGLTWNMGNEEMAYKPTKIAGIRWTCALMEVQQQAGISMRRRSLN